METVERIKEIKNGIDRIIRQHSFLNVPKEYRVYYLLCAYEYELDIQRDNFSREKIKKSLTFAYNIISSIDPFGSIQIDKSFNVSHIIEANQFLDVCFDYSGFVSAYIMFCREYANAELLDNNTIRFIPKNEGTRYDALDMKLSEELTESSVDKYISDPTQATRSRDINATIIQSVNMSPDHRISYSLKNIKIDDVMKAFVDMINGHLHLPDNWCFKGISPKEITAFHACLTGLAWAHLMAFQSQYQIYGDAILGEVLMLRGEKNLAGQISRISNVAKEKVFRLLELITYRSSDKKPDVAVTPLLRISSGHYLISPSLILTSNLTRNLLAHLARNYKDDFDRASSCFEGDMVERFKNVVKSKYRYITRIDLGVSDIDVALIDEKNHQVMICEFKWTIPPAETFEVLGKLEKESKAREQLGKIKAYFDQDRSEAENLFKVDNAEIFLVIVFENYVGRDESFDPSFPTVNYRIFCDLILKKQSLAEAYNEISQRSYLPVSGRDCEIICQELSFHEYKIIWQGFRPLY